MAIITALFGLLGRFGGRVLNTTLGWASMLLFGRIPEDRQVRFAMLTFGSLVWVAALVGILVPAAGVFLIALVPLPDWVDERAIQLAMIGAALLLPAILGAVARSISDPADRTGAGSGLLAGLVRGYLITPVLALTLGILALAGIVRKASAVVRRRTSGHIPVVVRPDRYDALVDQIDGILRGAGLVTGRRDGSRLLTAPARLLAAVSGVGLRRLVPDHLVILAGPDVDLEVYPSDLSMTGTKLGLARARAAVLRDLDSQHCWFTTAEAAKAIEDQLAKLDRADGWDPGVIRDVDRRLASEAIADEEWDVLYRRRLQLAAQATGTNLGSPGEIGGGPRAAGAAPPGPPTSTAGTLAGLALAGLVIADILLLATRGRDRTRGRNRK